MINGRSALFKTILGVDVGAFRVKIQTNIIYLRRRKTLFEVSVECGLFFTGTLDRIFYLATDLY